MSFKGVIHFEVKESAALVKGGQSPFISGDLVFLAPWMRRIARRLNYTGLIQTFQQDHHSSLGYHVDENREGQGVQVPVIHRVSPESLFRNVEIRQLADDFQTTKKDFSEFESLLGFMELSLSGNVESSTLPAGTLSEDISGFLSEMNLEYRHQRRVNNIFMGGFGLTTLIFTEHEGGAVLFVTKRQDEIDELLSLFSSKYTAIPVATNEPEVKPRATGKEPKSFLPERRIDMGLSFG